MKKKLFILASCFFLIALGIAVWYGNRPDPQDHTISAPTITQPDYAAPISSKDDFISNNATDNLKDAKLEHAQLSKQLEVYYAITNIISDGGLFSKDQSSALKTTDSTDPTITSYLITPETADIVFDPRKDGYYYFIEVFVPEGVQWDPGDVSITEQKSNKTFHYNKAVSRIRGEQLNYTEHLIGFRIPPEDVPEEDFELKVSLGFTEKDIEKTIKLRGLTAG